MDTTKRRRLAVRPDIILDAANVVLRERGARGLTIDAVAAAAGLSKGGVLHHFASKDALVAALVARKLTALRTGIAECEASQPPGPASLPRAMVEHFEKTYCDDDEFSRALLVASIENPDALADYRSFVAERLARLSEVEGGRGPGAVVFFALLGLAMGRTLGFHQLPPEDVEPMMAALGRVARGTTPDETG
jgi:AcrR family transcriptional regulator